MKFSILITALLMLVIIPIAQAQDQVVFKILAKPNTTYTNKTVTKSDVEFNVSGDETVIQQIKSGGGSFPMIISVLNEMEAVTTTGAEQQNKNIPMKLVYHKVQNHRKINENEITDPDILAGMVIEGYYDLNSKMHIDTIISSTVDQATKNLMRNTITSIQSQINFPETPLKKGESFEQIVPLEMPFPGFKPIKMLINMKYTLVDIRQNVAYFDVQQEATLNMDLEKNEVSASITATGSGNGACEFDLTFSTLTKYESNMAMKMEVAVSEIILNGTVNVKTIQLISVQ